MAECECLWDWPESGEEDSWVPDFSRMRDCSLHGDAVLIQALKTGFPRATFETWTEEGSSVHIECQCVACKFPDQEDQPESIGET